MLDVLLESRFHRPRQLRGTIASASLHGALVIAAIVLTHPTQGDARGAKVKPRPIFFVTQRSPAPPAGVPPQQITHGGASVAHPLPTLPAPDIAIPSTSIDVATPTIGSPASCDCVAAPTSSTLTSGIPIDGSPLTGVLDERLVDRPPRLLGRPVEPRYPTALREAGVQGRVVVQLVVDTLGRVEPGSLQTIQSSHALFTDAVREVLERYRFTPGEVGGRAVATRVQIPFDFKTREP